ncbi:tyrosyl-DNA phosphodiesterase 2-like isoform X4 [Symsagittifera roscoffensis]|uniref:tyrosyl-DNA phosphodiesterase 2-like isoform X4 n=1 Tax=Symsagittifera roscoffensis TaxID=84072 RepID=UPI00307B2EBF
MSDKIQLTADQQQLVYAFSQSTDCDLDLAYCLLSENNWQFNVTLQIYEQVFNTRPPEDDDDNVQVPPAQNVKTISAKGSTPCSFEYAKKSSDVSVKTEVIDLDDYSSPVQTYESLVEDEEDEDFYTEDVEIVLRFMSWNVDCLSEKLLKSRMVAIFNKIKQLKPDVVFLQEIIDPVLMSIYDVFLDDFLVYKPETSFGYFVIMLVRKATFSNVTFETINFKKTEMGRNLVRCKAEYFGMPLTFFTTHLGSVKEHQYTWDMSLNDNLENMPNKKVKCRFDRMYYISEKHKSEPGTCCSSKQPEEANDRLELKSFELIGTERLGCGMFASDHFGMLAEFKVNLT